MATRRPSLTPYAQKLRRNMTPEEIKLWTQFLRGLPVRARRQHPIGPYIVDFYIAATKTAIEVDGSQHYEDVGRAKDAARDALSCRPSGRHPPPEGEGKGKSQQRVYAAIRGDLARI